MGNSTDFSEQLSLIEQKYSGETAKGSVNIFNVLFEGHEEVTLHSRFISYLLSSNRTFLELFVRDILKIPAERFDLHHCEVFPNGQDKSEYEEIDILIINPTESQAIIVENKIHAEDSIHPLARQGYQGQLERYYNIITKGENKREYKCDEDKTYVYYLSLYKRPTEITIGELRERGVFDPEKHKIDYYQIQQWLGWCADKGTDPFLNSMIRQYLDLVKKMTSDNGKALAVINLIAENENYWQDAHRRPECFADVFNDVQWHAIHRFFTRLAKGLETQMPDERSIHAVAQKKKETPLVVAFGYGDEELYIANDSKNGFTWGNTKSPQNFKTFSDEKINGIKFYDFSNEETFHIINNDHREAIITAMIDEVKKRYPEVKTQLE